MRGFRGEFEHPPDLVAFPRDEPEIEAVLELGRGRGAAVVPFGGGTSVVGGVEARLGERPFVTLDLRRLDRVLEVDPASRAARIQAGATGPGAGGPAARARADPAPLPAVVRVLDPGRLGRDPGRRPLRHPLHPHRRPGRVGAGDHPARIWESRRLPGSGAGPSPDRMLIGSEGILGVITEAWVRVRPRPEFKASCGVEFADFRAAAEAVREISQSGLHPSNCRLLDAAEAGMTGAGDGEASLLVLGFESAAPPGRRADGAALELAREHGGERGEVRRRRRRGWDRRARRRRGRRLARRLPARALPARHLRRLRRALGDLRDGDHLGPLRGFPRRR